MNMIVSAAAISTASAAPRAEVRYEPAAILPRVELAIEASRRSAQVWGWEVDEEGAARALAFWQHEAIAGGDGEVPNEVMGFHVQHGHSIDWLVTGDPKGMLAMLAGQSDQARATAAARHDPIFAVIEAHRAAGRVYSDAVDISAALPAGKEFEAADAVTERAQAALDAAGLDLADIEPTTMAGLRDLLAYIGEQTSDDEFDGGNWRLPHHVPLSSGEEEHFMHRLLCSIEATLWNLTAPSTPEGGAA